MEIRFPLVLLLIEAILNSAVFHTLLAKKALKNSLNFFPVKLMHYFLMNEATLVRPS